MSFCRMSAVACMIAFLGCRVAPAWSADDEAVDAQTTWSGIGELGFAQVTGNTRSDNLNAKLGLNKESERWKHSFSASMLRARGQVETTDENGKGKKIMEDTADRYDANASTGYKFNPANYMLGAVRYEHDEFGANLWQESASVGYGHVFIKNGTTDLFTEIGPGYKHYRPANAGGDDKEDAIMRGLLSAQHRLTPNTSIQNVLLAEVGGKNQYYQNDTGLTVSMTQQLALKLSYQSRYNSNTPDGADHWDGLFTTNLIYNF